MDKYKDMPEVPAELYPQQLLDMVKRLGDQLGLRGTELQIGRIYLPASEEKLVTESGHLSGFVMSRVASLSNGVWENFCLRTAEAYAAIDYYRNCMNWYLMIVFYPPGFESKAIYAERYKWMMTLGQAQANG